MNKFFFVFIFSILFFGFWTLTLAEDDPNPGLVKCGHSVVITNEDGSQTLTVPRECTFADLIILGDTVLQWLVSIAALVVAVVFAIGGFTYMTAMGDTGKVQKAHKMFQSALVGFLIVLTAWLIVKILVTALGVDPNFNIYMEGNGNNPDD